MTLKTKIISITVAVVAVLTVPFCYVWFYFPYSDGWEAGTVNYFKHEGFIFKTYEGKVIQEGLKGQVSGTLSSNEFKFSVKDPEVAEKLNHCAGKRVELHYKQYLHSLWWRGDSRYVVDGIRK